MTFHIVSTNTPFAFAAAMHEHLLAKHILASSDGIQIILLMERVRDANVHHVHFWIRIGFVTAVYGQAMSLECTLQ